MTDQLRDRIAAILSDTLVADDSIVKLKYGDHGTSQIVVNCNPLADAVIRELGIYEDEMGTGDARRTRIVSDWEKP